PLHEDKTGSMRLPVLLLQAAALMVLLIACANLANLTLSRALGRQRELAVRAALGAGRGRLATQLLAESLLLAVAGGVLGLGIAWLATRTLLGLNPDALPAMFHVTVDVRVMLLSLVAAALTGVLFGLAPALGLARADLHDSLKEGGRGASGGRAAERLRRALAVAQIGRVHRLRDAAPMLPRRSLGARQHHVVTRAPDRRPRRCEHHAARGVRRHRQEIQHVDAQVARVSPVAPLEIAGLVRLPVERGDLRRRTMALPGRNRDGILVNAEERKRGRDHRAVRRLHLENVAAIDPESLRRLRVNLHPRRPADLRDRIRELLQPWLVRAASVAEHGRDVGVQRELTRAWCGSACRHGWRSRCCARRHGTGHDTLRKRRGKSAGTARESSH